MIVIEEERMAIGSWSEEARIRMEDFTLKFFDLHVAGASEGR